MNSLGVLSSGGLAGAERSEGERSEPQRSAVPAKAGAVSVSASRPDPEVVANQSGGPIPLNTSNTSSKKPKSRPPHEAALALFSAAKVCTRRC